MARMWAVVGDTTTSGGRVVSGSPFTDVDGMPVSRVTDQATCPSHNGTFPIIDGDVTTIIDGHPVALHGSSLACGCKVLATRQHRVLVERGSHSQARADIATGIPVLGTHHPHEHVATNFNEGEHDPHQSKARGAVHDANQALRSAGAYRPYETEVAAAKAWREQVLPVADEHRVEIGALISQTEDGRFHLGGAYSAGAYDNCNGLLEHGAYTEGQVVAYVHTHPYPDGWIGKDRGFSWNQTPEDVPGANLGPDVGSGDLVSAFSVRKNAYIADSAGLHGWVYDDYVQLLEQDRLRLFRLGEAYGTF